MVNRNIMRLTVVDLWRYERSTMYRAIPHLSPIGLSVIHQTDEKYVNVTFQRSHLLISSLILIN